MKRMLSYSSIAHAGYMLLALLSPAYMGASAILFYSVAYGISSMAAFIIIHIIQTQTGTDEAIGFTGLAQKIKCLHLLLPLACYHFQEFRSQLVFSENFIYSLLQLKVAMFCWFV